MHIGVLLIISSITISITAVDLNGISTGGALRLLLPHVLILLLLDILCGSLAFVIQFLVFSLDLGSAMIRLAAATASTIDEKEKVSKMGRL